MEQNNKKTKFNSRKLSKLPDYWEIFDAPDIYLDVRRTHDELLKIIKRKYLTTKNMMKMKKKKKEEIKYIKLLFGFEIVAVWS